MLPIPAQQSSLPLPDPAGFLPYSSTLSAWTPEKTYPFLQSPGGAIRVLWSPAACKKFRKKTVVYQIKNKINFKKYLGQSVDLFKRMSSHGSYARRVHDSLFSQDLHDHPEHFEVGAIVTRSPDRIESKLITQKNTISTGYNRRSGGGGGTARTKEKVSPKTFKKVFDHFTKVYQTPKRFPLKASKGHITYSAPKALLQKKNVIYRIQKKTSKGMHVYIGCTERTFMERLREHLFYANHAENKRTQASRLYKKLNRHASKFSISVIDSSLFPKTLPISAREQIVIQFYQNRGYGLYNCNRGGGGGAAKK